MKNIYQHLRTFIVEYFAYGLNAYIFGLYIAI